MTFLPVTKIYEGIQSCAADGHSLSFVTPQRIGMTRHLRCCLRILVEPVLIDVLVKLVQITTDLGLTIELFLLVGTDSDHSCHKSRGRRKMERG